ncbi:hypothetical protein DSM106972_096750 [Dulcicalothrix desertica PCC 7102]|uniref:PEP-CTERM protein-sorting domain-containing protein n=1 Tax=Dulcicalothrix desertica PCC 7102 TaxID=232991 RepID=A0A3S1BQU2_9CYAN|nr:PEP-CTERM sorting domain-containing protein [Dulcicalothrix desertica]RUS93319.1 hypothetical protein DSM106972_096750 [Dulcicalothrix desertica PCC 7102]
MIKLLLATTICLCSILPTVKARAANFTFNPTVTFEVGDGFSPGTFDGQGDTDAVFPGNFDTVVLGTFGENSENAEFNLSGLSIPVEETIAKATYQVTVLPNLTGGLGVSNIRPSGLTVRGYVGNEQPDEEDFQAGTILDTAKVSPEYIEETLNFDVTSFIQNIVSDGKNIPGFGIRAQNIGAITLDRGTFSGKGPKLLITTASTKTTVPEPSSTFGILACAFLGRLILNRKSQFLMVKTTK